MLDFAGNVERLGPITAPRVHSGNRGEAVSEAPVKVCPSCDSYIERAATRCEHCGFKYASQARRIGDNFDEVDPLYAPPLPVEAVTYRASQARPAGIAADQLSAARSLAVGVDAVVSRRHCWSPCLTGMASARRRRSTCEHR